MVSKLELKKKCRHEKAQHGSILLKWAFKALLFKSYQDEVHYSNSC